MPQTTSAMLQVVRPAYDFEVLPTMQPVGDAPYLNEDDDLLDVWLASLSVHEFEDFLGYLSDQPVGATAVLSPTG